MCLGAFRTQKNESLRGAKQHTAVLFQTGWPVSLPSHDSAPCNLVWGILRSGAGTGGIRAIRAIRAMILLTRALSRHMGHASWAMHHVSEALSPICIVVYFIQEI
jgi:hypothetical protein